MSHSPEQERILSMEEVSVDGSGPNDPGERRMSEAGSPGKGLVHNRVAFVTGAGRGIGRAVCEVLAREGARVIALDVNGENARRTVQDLPPVPNGSHYAVQADVRDEEIVKNAIDAEPTMSIAINCAGITSEQPLATMDPKAFKDCMDVNFLGTFNVVRNAGRVMLNAEGGSIVNVSSMTSVTGYPGLTHYTASKAAVEAMSKTTACEWGRRGVRCNVVRPGLIDTPLAHTYRGHIWSEYRTKNALGRHGEPREVAEVIVFLASDRSSYVNGAVIDITGGVL